MTTDELLDGLNPPQREAVEHRPGRCSSSPAPGRARRGCSRTGSPAWSRRACRPGGSSRSPSPTRRPTRCAAASWSSSAPAPSGCGCRRSTRRACACCAANAERLGYRESFTIYDDADTPAARSSTSSTTSGIDPKRFPARAVAGADQAGQVRAARRRRLRGARHRPSTSAGSPRSTPSTSGGCATANAMDFDDLLVQNGAAVPRARRTCSSTTSERFAHVLVDEYQDTNRAQNELVLLLGGEHRNVSVVGDADQSIYRFRGADIRNILDFERAFPDARTIVLDQNYRSTQTILDAANAVIANNLDAQPKALWSALGDGRADRLLPRRRRARRGDVRRQRDRRRCTPATGCRYGDFAVFYRTNAQTRAIEEALADAGRSPTTWSAAPRFYDRREVRDALAYLRAVANPRRRGVAAADRQRAPARHRRRRRSPRSAAFAAARGASFGEGLRRADEAGVTGRPLAGIVEALDLLDSFTASAAITAPLERRRRGRRGAGCWRRRSCSRGAPPHRLHRCARGRAHARGRRAAREPGRARLGGGGLRRSGDLPQPRRPSSPPPTTSTTTARSSR